MERVMLGAGCVPDAGEIADRMAIEDVLAVHCHGVDRADEVALKSAYWPDAEVAYGGFEGPAHTFCEMLPKSIVRFSHTQHCVSNVLIRFFDASEGASTGALGPTRAAVETYVTAYHYLASETPSEPDTEMTFLGRYLDRFERRDATWKISHRRVLMDWNQNAEATALWDGPPFDGLSRGGRYPADPVYSLFANHEE